MKRFLVSLSFVAVMGMTALLPSAAAAQSSAVPTQWEFELKIPAEREDHHDYRERNRHSCRWIKGHWVLGRHKEWVWVPGYRDCWRAPWRNHR